MSDINKCYEANKKNKYDVTRQICQNYRGSTHQGICRYDCSGETKGCESERENCKIIINLGDNSGHIEFTQKDKPMDGPQPGAKHIDFINNPDGSILKATQGPTSKWIQRLSNEGGKACKCNKRDENNLVDKNDDNGDGLKKPTEEKPQEQKPIQLPPPIVPQPQTDERALREEWRNTVMDNFWKHWHLPSFKEYKEYKQDPRSQIMDYWTWWKKKTNSII
jgi:hypothetical protein